MHCKLDMKNTNVFQPNRDLDNVHSEHYFGNLSKSSYFVQNIHGGFFGGVKVKGHIFHQ